MAAVTATAR